MLASAWLLGPVRNRNRRELRRRAGPGGPNLVNTMLETARNSQSLGAVDAGSVWGALETLGSGAERMITSGVGGGLKESPRS